MKAARRVFSAAMALSFVLSAAGAAADSPTLVVPVTDTTGKANPRLLKRLSKSVLDHIKREGRPAEAAMVGLGDILGLGGCTVEKSPCLKTLPSILEIQELVFGQVEEPEKDQLALTLYRVRPDAVDRTVHPIPGRDNRERALAAGAIFAPSAERESATAQVEPELAREEPPESDVVAGAEGEAERAYPDEPPLLPDPDPLSEPHPQADGAYDFGQVRGYAWAIAGSGAALALGSVLPYVLGRSKQSDIDAHPTATPEDFETLRGLESDARRLFRIGNGMLVGGAVLAAAGTAIIVWQARQPRDRERPLVTLSPTDRGAAVFVTFSR